MEPKVEIQWIDRGREARCEPNPKYPLGIDIDLSEGAAQVCKVSVPYPAKRCGAYVLKCERCGLKVSVTTAGRIDDPRSVKLACHSHQMN